MPGPVRTESIGKHRIGWISNQEKKESCYRRLIIFGELQSLGGHLKSGHVWSLENRPWRRGRDECFYAFVISLSILISATLQSQS
jgi:hypothetical protein